MRIEGPRAADGIRKNDKTRKTGGSSGSFKAFMDAESESAADVASAPMVGDVSALIAAQAYEDPTEKKARGRMMARAEDVLDALGGVHRGLVDGRLDTSHMEGVRRAVATQREKVADPVLSGLLDEVELRAQVELAKLEMAQGKTK